LTVKFEDKSTGSPDSWLWDFNNDGKTDYIGLNPTYTYNSAGVYSVKLKSKNSKTNSLDSLLLKDYIMVVSPVDAQFTANKTTGNFPLLVQFTDQSIGSPTQWQWDFNNDGIIDATTQHPQYTFSEIGKYTVKLIVSKTGAVDSLVKTNYITVNAPLNDIVAVKENKQMINISPNPTFDAISVQFQNLNSESKFVEIFDMTGKKIKDYRVKNDPELKVDMTAFPAGIYYLRTISNDKIFVNKIIKR
jgi:PKD repeat protein